MFEKAVVAHLFSVEGGVCDKVRRAYLVKVFGPFGVQMTVRLL